MYHMLHFGTLCLGKMSSLRVCGTHRQVWASGPFCGYESGMASVCSLLLMLYQLGMYSVQSLAHDGQDSCCHNCPFNVYELPDQDSKNLWLDSSQPHGRPGGYRGRFYPCCWAPMYYRISEGVKQKWVCFALSALKILPFLPASLQLHWRGKDGVPVVLSRCILRSRAPMPGLSSVVLPQLEDLQC